MSSLNSVGNNLGRSTANRTYFEAEINTISGVDLIVLPEMFSTGLQ
jgi:predicted amidohydrolase